MKTKKTRKRRKRKWKGNNFRTINFLLCSCVGRQRCVCVGKLREKDNFFCFFLKRFFSPQIKINFKTNQKNNDSMKSSFSNLKSSLIDENKSMMNKTVLKSKLKMPTLCDSSKAFAAWPNSNLNSRLLSTGGSKSFPESFYNLNG